MAAADRGLFPEHARLAAAAETALDVLISLVLLIPATPVMLLTA